MAHHKRHGAHGRSGRGQKAEQLSSREHRGGSRKQSRRYSQRRGLEWHLGRAPGLIWGMPAEKTGPTDGKVDGLMDHIHVLGGQ